MTDNQCECAGVLKSSKEFFDRSTKVLTEEDSEFAPVDGVFTVANQVAHVAQTVEWFIDGAFGPDGFSSNFEEMEKAARGVTSLKEAREWVDRAYARAVETIGSKTGEELAEPISEKCQFFGGLPRSVVIGSIADHTAHHRGALTAYARLRGHTPPMPYMDF